MPKQTIALAYTRPADALAESEYQALLETLSESARGRSFLSEHARRSRGAETNILLTAIERIEAQVRPRPPDPVYDDLRRVLDDLRSARARIEDGGRVPKAEQLDALLDLLLRRISKLLPPGPAATVLAPAQPPKEIVASSPRPPAARWLEEPLAPAPAVNDAGPPPRPAATKAIAKPTAETAAETAAKTTAKTGTKLEAPTPPGIDLHPAARTAPVNEIEAEIKALIDAEVESRAKERPAPPTTAKPKAAAETAEEALAAIMALSEEERIALFS